MPMEVPEELPLVAFSKREDPRDVLVLPEGETELNPEKPLGCSSLRRTLQYLCLRCLSGNPAFFRPVYLKRDGNAAKCRSSCL